MKKNYLYVILLLLSNLLAIGQKVTLTPTLVNATSVTGGPINLGSTATSNVSLVAQVDFPVIPGDTGTITIYFVNGSTTNIVNGGNGGSLFFGEGKTATRSFIIQLYSSDFSTSGGYIYAEYKTTSGTVYKSSNLSVIKNGTTTPSPNPINNDYETVPYGGSPLLPKFHDYYNVKSQDWIDSGNQIVKGNFPFYSTTNLRELTTFDDGRVNYSEKVIFSVVNFLSNLIDLRVDSKISNNQYLTDGQAPTTIIGNEATESHSEIITGSTRRKTVTNTLVNYQYQWQSRIKFPLTWSNMNYYFSLYGWTDIPNATGINYIPQKTEMGMEYRRLILEKPGDKSLSRKCATSNVVSVVPIYNDITKNIICCDQVVASGDVANPIDGASSFGSSSYQWQTSVDGVNWEEIYGANNQNYTPIMEYSHNNEFQSGLKLYRRLIFNFSDNKYYTSNVVKINFEPLLSTRNQTLKVYPNPTTSILNIEDTKTTLALSNITITDQSGNTYTPNSISIINSNFTQLNVSNLPLGLYFLNMNIKTEETTRGYYIYRTTFIKQ